ncbi:hypothetical protein [Mesonia sp. K7]|uniref:hypothetical protein n=1 Tax=Mesonia sp. K7 TaxID=2218606 RepID=UPI000DA8249F|nr:hypothetical protein [Mesonia sp. K7]PZD78992.1 hypothetical protein DNG35_03020 [Mesonia sp. K7]
MSEKNDYKVLKILLGILALFLILAVGYSYLIYQENEENGKIIASEKQKLKEELDQLEKKYESIIVENKSLREDLIAEKQRISNLLDSLETMEMTADKFRRYQIQVDLLKQQNVKIQKVVENLQSENQQLQKVIDSTSTELQLTQQKSDSLQNKNTELEEKVKKASLLQLSNLAVFGIYGNQKQEPITTSSLKRTNEISSCFLLVGNEFVETGKKKLYMQIINPKNNLMGMRKMENFGEKQLIYSASTEVDYQNKPIETCISFVVNQENLVKGDYIINIFEGESSIATQTFTLE